MNKQNFLIYFWLALITALNQAPRRARAPFALEVADAASSVSIGKPVVLRVTLSNPTEHKISFFYNVNITCDFQVEIRDASGTMLTETGYRREVCDGPAPKAGQVRVVSTASQIAISLEPGETLQYDIDVSQQFRLDNPGEYFAHVECTIPKLWKTPVKSNISKVTLVK